MGRPPIYIPYGPPGAALEAESDRPAAVLYFRIYCGFMAFFALVGAGFGVLMLVAPMLSPGPRPSGVDDPSLWIGGIYAAMGLAMTILYVMGTFLGQRPWVHTFGTVLIALTMTQCACIPLALPLLLVWLKPEVKAWYHGAAGPQNP